MAKRYAYRCAYKPCGEIIEGLERLMNQRTLDGRQDEIAPVIVHEECAKAAGLFILEPEPLPDLSRGERRDALAEEAGWDPANPKGVRTRTPVSAKARERAADPAQTPRPSATFVPHQPDDYPNG